MESESNLNPAIPVGGWARPAKMSKLIYEEVFARITGGTYKLDSKLPTELELSAEFQVSRPVVREALARLRNDSLVESRKGAGTFVRWRPDQKVLQFAPVGSITDLQRCLEFRRGLEGECAFYAAERRDVRDLRKIREAMDALRGVLQTGSVGVEEDFNFHLTIAAASKNPFFLSTLTMLREQICFGMNLTRSISCMRPEQRLIPVMDEHVSILNAIEAGDPALACATMREHLTRGQRRLFEGDLTGTDLGSKDPAS